jgi:hypothetical protein
MKKIISIFVVIILLSITVKAQKSEMYKKQNEIQTKSNATHISQYLLPIAFTTCENILSPGSGTSINNCYSTVHPIAIGNPYYSDSNISVIGIAVMINSCYNPNGHEDSCFLQIRDGSANNILASVRYDTLTPFSQDQPNSPIGLFEFMFDSAITVSNNFTVVLTRPYNSRMDIIIPLTNQVIDSNGNLVDCNSGFSPLIQYNDGSWHALNNIPYFERGYGRETLWNLFLFPIISNTSGINDNVQVDRFSSLFPNPARDEINIASSFKINNIVVYNTLGQKIIEKNINSNTTKLDVSKFVKGNYIANIYTDYGVSTKKFIVE